ncbi:MAG: gamma-glutamylcyclotransferase [Candidatus Thiodiazotropha endolucinida]|nr:gamma-glutamylcyclotransferase [Candidatus Thiodiazotropha taylori]MCW4343713.1 gamma-glutamylcyclotransferase [Candidatus Thiodiazotropha endolucinida]MCG8046009.1 gamma-glutamylcyclotransferase [Candidatus Thiodiazotropha taylori]MCG8051887.1 gamma-glutamylcyclotransferase [Candidatus Thiodiazotropha taylori]MCW4313706.1 gamma-glutamylcyclotransferase [Candidatus Thiodiazotropha taylori]
MWVFGYGSLMWDDWHTEFGGKPVKARLPDFRRRFNKASVKNWGTKTAPGPTLNIEGKNEASCVGMAFLFTDDKQSEILTYLQRREGKSFGMEEYPIVLQDGSHVTAFVPFYRGPNILDASVEQLVEMALQATGTSGRCSDYVQNIDRELASHGIDDEEVQRFAALLLERL